MELELDGLVQAPPGSRTDIPARSNASDALKLFVTTTSLHPSYGGPAYSVSRLATALSGAGIQVGLWASDQSAATTPLLSHSSPVGRLTGTLVEALDRFGETSVLHDNGIWRSHHHQAATLASRRGIPRVVSTRGMLEPWAMNHKRFKKRLAWWLYQQRDLKRADCHHVTAEQEARNVERLALGVEIRVIPNGIDLPPPRQPTETGRRTALFLGRIYPVKGLPMLVEAWARVRPRGWILKIAGPDEAGHRAAVEQAVAAADLQNTITFVGPVDGPSKHSSLDGAALFILPTHSESFGIAVAEALAHGLPVLTTTAAPWPALSEQGCGWRVAPTVDGLAAGLREATSVDQSTLEAMGARGRAFVAAKLAWDRIAEQYVAMYEELLGARC